VFGHKVRKGVDKMKEKMKFPVAAWNVLKEFEENDYHDPTRGYSDEEWNGMLKAKAAFRRWYIYKNSMAN
jgi:hypothetical protein